MSGTGPHPGASDPLERPTEAAPAEGGPWAALGARGLAAALRPLARLAGIADDIKAMSGDVNRMADSTSTLPEVTEALKSIRARVDRLDREVLEMHAAVEEMRELMAPLASQLEGVTRITNRLPGGRRHRRAQELARDAEADAAARAHDASEAEGGRP